MSYDVKYFTVCDHNVSGKTYRPDMCVRCYGKGYYLDIEFDKKGAAILADGAIKMQQEVLKIMLDERGSDLFSPNWGSEIHLLVGHKQVPITRTRLEIVIRRALEHLKQLQETEAQNNRHITAEEILEGIDWIAMKPISVNGWSVFVAMKNGVSEIYTQEVDFS